MKQSPGTRGEQVPGLRHLVSSTWFAPALLAMLFVVFLAGLLWLFHSRSLQVARANLNSSISTAQESMRLRLHATRDHLVTMAEDMARHSLNQELFSERLAHYMAEHPELVSAMYVDAEGEARWAVPKQWEEKVLGRPLACPRSLEVSRLAEASGTPVYSDVHISLQNEPAFDLCVPIQDQQNTYGVIVAVYSCERMLRNMISREIVHEHRASLIDGEANTLVTLPAVQQIDERLSAIAELDPPGRGFALRLDRYGSGFWGVGMTLMVVLCVGLAFGMSWGMWSLQRQIIRRLEAERQMHEAHDSLAERVRERTVELETANKRLKTEMIERRRAEEESRQHQEELAHVTRVSTMGEMATGLAHELNQPLGAIANFAEGGLRLMDADSAHPDALRMAFTEISEQARRAGTIIHRMRSFVATGEPRREPHKFKRLVGELMDLVDADCRQEQIDLYLDVPDLLPTVLVDGIQIQQVLLNLIRNAIEALSEVDPAGRRITVTAAPGDNGTLAVAVSDTGPGCPPEMMTRLFEAFYTTKKSGIGMGLSISRSIIDAHGGRIWATDQASGGLTVQFTIPTLDGEYDVPA
ncbi:MAG: GHKL domain-containing protein [Phycisphaeraceae bacterium]|nr:GHKL domain-containing protein [Phycisphaeraceae bacterium]